MNEMLSKQQIHQDFSDENVQTSDHFLSGTAPTIASHNHGGKRLSEIAPTSTRNTPLISVITVVYNGVSQLRATIESVLQQKRGDIEYIIIDGGSTDGTRDLLLSFNSDLDYWVSEPDAGIYDAMNKAVQLAVAGTYILFLGAGDRILHLPEADTIDHAKNSGIHLLYGDVLIGESLFSSSFNGKLRYRNTLHHQGMFLLKGHSTTPWFDKRLKVFADWDLNLSLFQRGAVAKRLDYTVACAEPGGVSASLHLSEIMRMIHHRCGPLTALAAAIYHGTLHLLR